MKVGSTSNCLKYFSLVKDGREEGLVVILAKVCFDYFFLKMRMSWVEKDSGIFTINKAGPVQPFPLTLSLMSITACKAAIPASLALQHFLC